MQNTAYALRISDWSSDVCSSDLFSRKDSVFQEEYVTRHDFNVGGFDSNPGGELEFGLSYLDKPSRDDANSGWAVTVQHVQSDFLGGKTHWHCSTVKGRAPASAIPAT